MAVERLKARGQCTSNDYEDVMKSLRYQLVAMAMGYMCQHSTPRIEVKVYNKHKLVTEILLYVLSFPIPAYSTVKSVSNGHPCEIRLHY